jgi:hypothetical protein
MELIKVNQGRATVALDPADCATLARVCQAAEVGESCALA